MRPELLLVKERDKKIMSLKGIEALLSWDQETILPEKANDYRSQQMGLMSSIIQEEATKDDFRRAVESLDGDESLALEDRALVHYWKRFFQSNANLPISFVKKEGEALGRSHQAWLKARCDNDFSYFAPYLENLVALSKEKAKIIAPDKSCYDALLDLYEEDLDKKLLDPLFDDLIESTHSLMDKIEDKEIDDSMLYQSYDERALHSFSLELNKRMGFDNSRGYVALSAHPFTTMIGPDDIRLTTRYTDPSIFDPISSIVHETGHALYDLNANLNEKIAHSSIGQGVSMGIHESQSRFWENMMGRSLAYWTYMYPILQDYIPSLKSVKLDDFYKAINKVKPSAIRVNADEVTYNLHIILRYKMEKLLFEGNVEIRELPELWNKLSKELIRYDVKDDREGILQDVHWAGGLFGYFPTYSLGNLYGAAFRSKLISDLGGPDKLDRILESGNWSEITCWQNENIWKHGGIYSPSKLIERVTGKSLDANAFKVYLIEKYSRIYDL